MRNDEAKGSAKQMRGEVKEKARQPASKRPMQAGGTAGGLNERTKKGLGKTRDKIRDQLKG